MIVDLSCPIELRGYELLMDDNGHTRAYIRLFNLSERAVVAYSATTRWYNGLTRADVTENITVDEMLVKPRSGFQAGAFAGGFSERRPRGDVFYLRHL